MNGLKQMTPAGGGTGRAPALLFTILAVLGGTAMLVTLPPMQAPEEASHFARAYQVSEGGWLPQKRHGEAGGFLPTSLVQLIQTGEATTWHGESHIDKPLEFYHDLFQVPLEPGRRSFAAFPKAAAEPPLAYVPQAAGIRMSRLVSDSALATLYGARLGSLLAAIVCIAAAILLTPVYKWAFACLALTPMAVAEMASATGYGPTYGVVFLFVALVLRLAYGGTGPAARREILALFVLAAGLGWVLQGHLALIFLYLLVPAERFGGRKRYWLVFVALVLVAAGAEAGWQVAQALRYSPAGGGVDPVAQARLVLEQPRLFGSALQTGLGQPPLIDLLARAYSGVWMAAGWVTPIPLVVLFTAVLLGVCVLDRTPGVERVTLAQRLVVIAVAALCLGVVFLLTYLSWMPVGAPTIYVRPRQVLPAGLALLLCLFNLMRPWGRFAAFVRAHLGLLVVVYFLLRYVHAVLAVMHRYYRWDS
jgi:uncharacterized membrane protein